MCTAVDTVTKKHNQKEVSGGEADRGDKGDDDDEFGS